jgi:hypothetical protein
MIGELYENRFNVDTTLFLVACCAVWQVFCVISCFSSPETQLQYKLPAQNRQLIAIPVLCFWR